MRYRKVLIIFFLGTLLALFLSWAPHDVRPLAALGAGWVVEAEDVGARSGQYPAPPRQSAYPTPVIPTSVPSAQTQGPAGWVIQVIAAGVAGASMGWQSSLAVDSAGRPHISYMGDYSLKYAWRVAPLLPDSGGSPLAIWPLFAALALALILIGIGMALRCQRPRDRATPTPAADS